MESGHVSFSKPIIETVSTAADSRERRLILAKAFIKYAVVGGAAFAVDFGLFSICIDLGMHYLLAVTLGFCAGLVSNYILCVLWVWRGTQARSLRDILVFTLVGLGGLALTWLGMWICVELLKQPERSSKVFMAAIILFWNFSLRRIFVFFR